MNILVTGGAGFIGTHLIRRLRQSNSNHKIVSLDNYFTGVKSNHIADVTYIQGDTINIGGLLNGWKPDIVYHLGEYSRIVKSFDDINLVWKSNVNGTKAVLDYCVSTKAKIVYAGSSSKFGNHGKDENLSPYAWTKAKNVELIKNYETWFGLEYAVCYFFNVYGPGQICNGPYSTVIGIFEQQYTMKQPLTVVAPGTQTRDFTHVFDIVDGVVLVGEKGNGDGYTIGSGQQHSILDIAKMFNTDHTLVPERVGERLSGQANTTKMLNEFGWIPKHSLYDYIKCFINNDILPTNAR